jgi:hypothetical protein
MPLFRDFRPDKDVIESRIYFGPTGGPKYLLWNPEVEAWEQAAQSRWYECGHPLEHVNRLCTKLIGHGGEHGKRRDVDG